MMATTETGERRALEETHKVLNDLLALIWSDSALLGTSVARDALRVLGRNALADPSLPLTVAFADTARRLGAGADGRATLPPSPSADVHPGVGRIRQEAFTIHVGALRVDADDLRGELAAVLILKSLRALDPAATVAELEWFLGHPHDWSESVRAELKAGFYDMLRERGEIGDI
jgi:hypothetical protein